MTDPDYKTLLNNSIAKWGYNSDHLASDPFLANSITNMKEASSILSKHCVSKDQVMSAIATAEFYLKLAKENLP